MAFPEKQRPCRLGILISGRGSNLMALQTAIENGQLTDAEIAVVVSNREEAAGLSWAREKNIPAVGLSAAISKSKAERDNAITETLKNHHVDLVILAGYDRILGEPILAAYPERILNIHPSLLPAYGGKNMVGLNVHRAVLEAGEKESGCTVHLVTEVIDGGSILGQNRVQVLSSDTPETLAARVLEQEHKLYAQVVNDFIKTLSSRLESFAAR